MVSDSELIERLREFLKSSDLETTTTTIVRRKLEEDFGVDLSDKKAFIREQVDLFLQSQLEEEVEGGGDDQKSEENGGDEVEEEEEEADEAEVVKEEEVEGVRPSSKKPVEEGKKRGGGGGFTKICSLSPQLQEFLGAPEMARTEVVKQLWCYIREKDLQDPSNRKNILCDEPLRALFHVDSINMFQMNKALAKHIWPLDSDDVLPAKTTPKEKQKKQEKEEVLPAKTTPKEKQKKQKKEEEPDDSGRKEKRQKGGTSGLMAPIQLSEPLIKFLGTSENALPRSEVVKRMWDYIKQNNLQDPSDKRQVICDEKLKELFDLDSFTGFTVSKLLSAHFVKT
ncbi:Upstream activation factor subunit spp27 [Linum perenne]